MKLTKRQLVALKDALRYREQAPTVSSLLRREWYRALAVLGFIAFVAVLAWLNNWVWLELIVCGYAIGVVERDIQWLRNYVSYWSIGKEITDWQKVEQLVKDNERPAT